MIDLDYHSQIEYRWGGEGLRKTLIRWAAEKNNESGQNVIVEDEECSSTYCISFKVTNTEAVCFFRPVLSVKFFADFSPSSPQLLILYYVSLV
jgi:hypothetical protein